MLPCTLSQWMYDFSEMVPFFSQTTTILLILLSIGISCQDFITQLSEWVNKTFFVWRSLEIRSEFLFNYEREAVRNSMALDFDGAWDCEGPSGEGLCNPRQKSACWPHVLALLISLPYLDWLGVDQKSLPRCCAIEAEGPHTSLHELHCWRWTWTFRPLVLSLRPDSLAVLHCLPKLPNLPELSGMCVPTSQCCGEDVKSWYWPQLPPHRFQFWED